MRDLRSRHPRFREAAVADAKITLELRGDPPLPDGGWRRAAELVHLAWRSDAFMGQVLYRAKARLQALGVPFAPRLCHRLAMALSQVAIGDPVHIKPGLYLLHGQVVIDGLTEIGARVVIAPFVTIGLRPGHVAGPVIEDGVSIGTGAKVLGNIRVGAGAKIAANSVVLSDVEPGVTVAGAPATPVNVTSRT
jgi:serine O-acetyltransferase